MFVQCTAGLNHEAWDDNAFSSCPKCSKVETPKNSPPRATAGGTGTAKPSGGGRVLPVTKLFWEPIEGSGRANATGVQIQPISGWLVAVVGPQRGKAFPLYFDRNPAGRDASAVVLIEDDTISREITFVLTYDRMLNKYWIAPFPNSKVLVHLDRRAKYFYDPQTGAELLDSEGHPLDSSISIGIPDELTARTELNEDWNWYIHIGRSLLKFVPFFDRLTMWEYK